MLTDLLRRFEALRSELPTTPRLVLEATLAGKEDRIPEIVRSRAPEAAVQALVEVARAGQLVAVEALLESGVDPRRATLEEETPLAVACAMGHLDVARRLIEIGTPILSENGHCRALQEAAAALLPRRRARNS